MATMRSAPWEFEVTRNPNLGSAGSHHWLGWRDHPLNHCRFGSLKHWISMNHLDHLDQWIIGSLQALNHWISEIHPKLAKFSEWFNGLDETDLEWMCHKVSVGCWDWLDLQLTSNIFLYIQNEPNLWVYWHPKAKGWNTKIFGTIYCSYPLPTKHGNKSPFQMRRQSVHLDR